MVIVAVLTTIGMISVGTLGADRGLDNELERYTDVAAAAIEQAQLEGRDFGVLFAPDGYRVLVYAAERDRWESLPDDRLYEFHRWPEGVRATLAIEGKVLPLAPARPGTTPVPQVLLFASGDVSPYVVTLTREGAEQRFVVEGLPDGTLEVQRPGEPS